jgi:hypothetical protein
MRRVIPAIESTEDRRVARIVNSRCVLAVRDLEASTVLHGRIGFSRHPIDAEGWSFLMRDNFKVMLGECRNERPAGELGDHSYFVYWNADGFGSVLSRSGRSRGTGDIRASRQALGPSGIRSSHARRASHHVWRTDRTLIQFSVREVVASKGPRRRVGHEGHEHGLATKDTKSTVDGIFHRCVVFGTQCGVCCYLN